jgi:hypothetical protein
MDDNDTGFTGNLAGLGVGGHEERRRGGRKEGGRRETGGGRRRCEEIRMADRQQDTTQRGPPAWRAVTRLLDRRREISHSALCRFESGRGHKNRASLKYSIHTGAIHREIYTVCACHIFISSYKNVVTSLIAQRSELLERWTGISDRLLAELESGTLKRSGQHQFQCGSLGLGNPPCVRSRLGP